MHFLKQIYKVIRGILFTAVIFLAVVYLVLYVLLSVPAFQNSIKDRVEKELAVFLGTEVHIGSLTIHPFNEVVVRGLEVYDQTGNLCLATETVGAGISIWTLIKDREIVLTYGEIIGLDARIIQKSPDEALNIAFLIDAFKPKDKSKPPTKFDFTLHNVVIRRSSVAFDRQWKPRIQDSSKTDFDHFRIWDLKADLTLPRIANDDFTIDLRRLSFRLSGGLDVEKLAFRSHITSSRLTLEDFMLQLPSTEFLLGDLQLEYNGFDDIQRTLSQGTHQIEIRDSHISPADMRWLVPRLSLFPEPLTFRLSAIGNTGSLQDITLNIASEDNTLELDLKGQAENLQIRDKLRVKLEHLKLVAKNGEIHTILERQNSISPELKKILENLNGVDLEASGEMYPYKDEYKAHLDLSTGCGDVSIKASGNGLMKKNGLVRADIRTEHFDVATLTGKNIVGTVTADLNLDGNLKDKDFDGELIAAIEEIVVRGSVLTDVQAQIEKSGKDISFSLETDNNSADLTLEADLGLYGKDSRGELHADIRDLNFDIAALLPEKYRGYNLTGRIDADLMGNNVDNLSGEVRLLDMTLNHPNKPELNLDHLILKASTDSVGRILTLDSDWMNGSVKGNFKFDHLAGEIKSMLSKVFPSLLHSPANAEGFSSDVSFSFMIQPDNTLPEFLNLPVRFLVGVPVRGTIDAMSNLATLQVDARFLQQGKSKLLRDLGLELALDGESGTLNLKGGSILPVRRGELRMDFQVYGQDDNIFTDILWETPESDTFKGGVSLEAALSRNSITSRPEVKLQLQPSNFSFGATKWNIDHADISYADEVLNVDNLKIWHDDQFVKIDGRASASPQDTLRVDLASIDVGYVFDLLNVRYVTFAGSASGSIVGNSLFSKSPVALTDNLRIDSFSYNGAILGDAKFRSGWNHPEKQIAIDADINSPEGKSTLIDGGIWLGKDSLCFDIDADRLSVDFLQPFMKNFASDVRGKASGKARLFGTFKDIDLWGRMYADTIAMRLTYTNVDYHGADSVHFDPGKIIIPSFRLYDRFGNSALFSGDLKHNFFRNSSFTFRLTDARHLLCFDTNQSINPDWYGVFYGNGGAVVRGEPGQVRISVDMGLTGPSSFTFALNDTQAAEDYTFLTFSDRRKEAAQQLRKDTVEDILSTFRKKVAVAEELPTRFSMDVRASVTPSTLMTLLMDPVAGDKITARGNGNIQIDYDSEAEQMQMFGKYILDEGNYRFSLQDLILRDFKIRGGSSIAFNGDPMNADLDITASYRVNTNLSDLDKSFSTDRDLARTNVPVDAMLMVDGPMTHPDISFDIELPTLTQDVERKVKSIISTDDMMSRQIIYLLALNRFSTPEYMGTSSNGGEFASMASSTLSSQISNMFGQLTDKFSLAPSFRSDKGDFSDIEVDVALSSRLLNNRLLINGNFGYRDRSTSQTTFVGDFDIEYLLRRGGNLRLKAYNHFNDQNYYLRQALTTQGLGIIYRKEFDNPFTKLRKDKEKAKGKKTEEKISED